MKKFCVATGDPDGEPLLTMSGVPKDPSDYTRPINFRPNKTDAKLLEVLTESTKLRGAQLIRHALAELERRDRARRARERGSVAA